MTWHIPLAMTRRDEVEDEDEAFQTTQQRNNAKKKGVAWMLVDMWYWVEDPRMAQHRSRRLTTPPTQPA
jgi:hypothetical protein